MDNLDSFDWFERRPSTPAFKKSDPITLSDARYIMLTTGQPETIQDRHLRMLRSLNILCQSCSMCELGRQDACKDGICRDPHVLSNMISSRFFIIGQGPGWTEVEKREPFMGASGANFDEELAKNGLDRNDFYITNAVKCFITGNKKPNQRQLEKCRPFLEIEINLLHPRFIITLGAAAFSVFCPDIIYNDALGRFNDSTTFAGVKVYSILHPSPLNLCDSVRRAAFANQIKMLSGVIRRLSQK